MSVATLARNDKLSECTDIRQITLDDVVHLRAETSRNDEKSSACGDQRSGHRFDQITLQSSMGVQIEPCSWRADANYRRRLTCEEIANDIRLSNGSSASASSYS